MSSKQAVCGFKVSQYQVKKSKDSEMLRLILEADVGDVTAGSFGFGDVLKALWVHQSSDTDVGFSLFMTKEEDKEEPVVEE